MYQAQPYSAKYSANQYRTNSVNTSPLQLVVMCYDGMLRFIKKAGKAIREKDIESKVKYINKTLAIVDELQNTLDFRGGEVARNLDRVYDYFSSQLMKATMHNDLNALDHTEKLIGDLRVAWAKAASESMAPAPAPLQQNSITITG